MSNLKITYSRVPNLQSLLKQLLSNKRPSTTEKLVKSVEQVQQNSFQLNHQIIIQNKNYKILFDKLESNFYNFCKDASVNNFFKFVYVNYERYNYTLIEYICLFNKGEKFSILDFCTVIGIFIPHFCYHPDLSIAGNCRMCLVQLDGSIKPVASCAITMSNKMIINTQSIFVKKAQEGVMEFLLLNHPLDCPICDQGGECDLQDLSLAYGNDRGRLFHLKDLKRSVNDMNCNDFVKFVLTRCIHCTRCIRFLNEYGGNYNMGMLGRGKQSEIGLYINSILSSELSSNIIELCPVGALTSKTYSFTYRAWDSPYYESIDFTDSLCSSIRVFTNLNKIVRVLPQYDEVTNWNFLTEKARFLYDGINIRRLKFPALKKYKNDFNFERMDLKENQIGRA